MALLNKIVGYIGLPRDQTLFALGFRSHTHFSVGTLYIQPSYPPKKPHAENSKRG